MTSQTRPNLNQIGWTNCLAQFESEMSDSWQYNSTRAPQYEPNIFVTVATYWVPDLPDINDFSAHPLNFKLIFANGAQSAWPSKQINMSGWVHGLLLSFNLTAKAGYIGMCSPKGYGFTAIKKIGYQGQLPW